MAVSRVQEAVMGGGNNASPDALVSYHVAKYVQNFYYFL